MTISAFKLFYDEFIYKKNVMINYLNIDVVDDSIVGLF